MNRCIRTLAAASAISLGLLCGQQAQAGPNAAIDTLQNTPVSLLTYGLAALDEGINGYLGRGGAPAPSAVFKAPLSGPVADFATVLFDQNSGTITLNLIHIADLAGGTPDEACKQAFAAMHLFAAIDPLSGKLSSGETESILPAFFAPDGTQTRSPDQMSTLDRAFRLRFNGTINGQRFVCNAPLFGADYELRMLK